MRSTIITADLSIAVDTTFPSRTCFAVTATGARWVEATAAVFTETRVPMTAPAEKARELIVDVFRRVCAEMCRVTCVTSQKAMRRMDNFFTPQRLGT